MFKFKTCIIYNIYSSNTISKSSERQLMTLTYDGQDRGEDLGLTTFLDMLSYS
jgi:hypothetical protein